MVIADGDSSYGDCWRRLVIWWLTETRHKVIADGDSSYGDCWRRLVIRWLLTETRHKVIADGDLSYGDCWRRLVIWWLLTETRHMVIDGDSSYGDWRRLVIWWLTGTRHMVIADGDSSYGDCWRRLVIWWLLTVKSIKMTVQFQSVLLFRPSGDGYGDMKLDRFALFLSRVRPSDGGDGEWDQQRPWPWLNPHGAAQMEPGLRWEDGEEHCEKNHHWLHQAPR